MSDRHPNVVHVDELPWQDGPSHGERFASRTRRLGAATGGKRLGCSLYELAPGKRAFPFHAHLATEEAIFVLEGEGTLRIGDREVPVRAGDYVALPCGPDHAHQMVNGSAAPLRYLCMSSALPAGPDVAVYPDSRKIGVMGGEAAPSMRSIFDEAAAGSGLAAYWKGED